MSTYLYRAVSFEHVDDAPTGEPLFWPGAVIGRKTGYLSRSAATEAGRRSGVQFKVVRSNPVTFPEDREISAAQEIDELRAEIERVRSENRQLRSLGVLAA